MKDKKQQNEKKPKSRLVSFCVSATALILVFAVCFTFLIFSTDVVINIDMQNSTNYDVVKPTSVSVTIQQVESVTQNPSTGNGVGDGTPAVPPDNIGITPPPNTTPIVDKDLKDWVDNCPIKFSNTQKQDTLALMYYVMNKNGYSDEQISGVLGNVCIEGSVGRFEYIPYGIHGGWKDYYANSWSKPSIYETFTKYTLSNNGNQSREYSEIYSNKVVQDTGRSWEDLTTMFNASVNSGVYLYGFGCIQFTDPSYHKNFLNFIQSNSLTGLTDFYTVAEMETSNLIIQSAKYFNQNTPTTYSSMCKNSKCTVAQVQSAVGYTSGPEAEVIEAASIFYCRVERVSGGETVANIQKRAEWGVTCYHDIKAAGY